MITLNGHEVKVGDRLWSVMHGEFGKVVKVTESHINIQFVDTFHMLCPDGSYTKNGPQVLFWDKVEIIPPPKPKRKVKKWHALIKVVNGSYGLSQEYYSSLGEAQAHYATIWRQAIRLIPETEQEFDE